MSTKTKKNEVAKVQIQDVEIIDDNDKELEIVDDRKVQVEPLKGNETARQQGNFVHDHQTMSETHSNVSQLWADKCISFAELLEKLEEEKQRHIDQYVPMKALQLVNRDGKLAMQIDGVGSRVDGEYAFTANSMNKIVGPEYCRLGYRWLSQGIDEYEKNAIADLYCHRWETRTKALADRQYLVRLRDDGTIRALLTQDYRVIDTRWLAGVQASVIGTSREECLVSHYRGDADFFSWNLLIGDRARDWQAAIGQEGFGGMLSSTNSEIGLGRYKCLPSLFRAICMNGCIWGAISDERFEVSGVHKGSRQSLDELAGEIIVKLNSAIPLLAPAIETFKELHRLGCDDVLLTLLQVARDLKFTKEQRNELLMAGLADRTSNMVEKDATVVVNALSRMGQMVDDVQAAVNYETIAGNYIDVWSKDREVWDVLVKRANQHKLTDDEKTYADLFSVV